MVKRRRFVGIAIVLAVLFAACGPAATPTPTKGAPTPTRVVATPTPGPTATPTIRTGGTLRVSSGNNPTSLDAHASTGMDQFQGFHIYDALTRLSVEMALLPGLAESWDTPDQTTYILHLRKGVKFHDGTDFNAQVAKWNLDRLMDPKTVSPMGRKGLADLDSVQVMDDYTIRLNLKKPSIMLLQHLAKSFASVVSPAAVQKWGDKEFGLSHPVGAGPFEFVSWIQDSRVTLKKFASYWGAPKPYLDGLEFQIVPDNTVAVAGLRTGGLDLIPSVVSMTDVETLQKEPGITVYPFSGNYLSVLVNMLRPPLDNIKVRQAINLAIDREAILNIVWRGKGQTISTVIVPALPEYNSSLAVVKRDLVKARQLLGEAGYAQGLTIECLGLTGLQHTKVCEVMQSQLAEVGIKVEITEVAVGQIVAFMTGLKYQVYPGITSSVPIEERTFTYLHSQGGYHKGRFGNIAEQRRLDELIDTVNATLDGKTRKAAFDEIQKIAYDNVLDFPSVWTHSFAAARNRVQNFVPYIESGKMWFHEVWLKD